MANPESIKYYLNNRLLFLLLMFLAFSINVKAGNIDTIELMASDEPLIQDITYDYQLFYNNDSELDCVGTLNLSISLPGNTSHLLFERTRSHITGSDPSNVIFKVKSEYPITSTNIINPDMYWGTYFRICAIFSNGDRVYSPTYSINDYIDPQDLDLLLSSVEGAEINEIDLQIENKNLYVNAHETLSLSVFDLSGKLLFTGEIQQTAVVPLDNTSSPVVIVTYRTSSATKTIKMLIQ